MTVDAGCSTSGHQCDGSECHEMTSNEGSGLAEEAEFMGALPFSLGFDRQF